MDAHDLVAKLKELASELGRTPTRREFEVHVKGGTYQLAKFGGYTPLVQAAGLEVNRAEKPRKIDNTIFVRDIEKQIEDFTPRPLIQKPWPKIASISDIHWPFSSKRVLDSFLAFIEKQQPEYVFINGDAWDMFAHSKYPRSHNVYTPREEQNLARRQNEEFWAEVKKRCPAAQCVQMMGNHDIRPLKRILESYPEAEDWIVEKLKQLFTFEGVQTVMDPREEFMIGDIAIFHGYRTGLGAHRDYTHFNCINGHTHKGGTVFKPIRGAQIWELNSGVAGDPESKGLTYTPQRITDWTPGFGFVDELGPRFIPA
jgi:predicted phosphodiesterase